MDQLQKLRQQWLAYKSKGDTIGMRLTEIRAKLVKKDFSPDKNLSDVFITPIVK